MRNENKFKVIIIIIIILLLLLLLLFVNNTTIINYIEVWIIILIMRYHPLKLNDLSQFLQNPG
ncbi:MAG: hypothetical protein N7Q72_07610, partial [Spiroplasma sp. Tabriz.8]|nr:hypothetical protein [Spiroplasma sp. Tabriz.8]